MRLIKLLMLASCITAEFSCGSDVATTAASENPAVVITNLSFVPQTLSASAGETVVILNEDAVPHHILSQSAENSFDNTGDFDSQTIPAGKASLITIPDTALSGRTLFFYDEFFKGAMATPNGRVEVE